MAVTNHEGVGKALELLRSGLGPFVEREFKNAYRSRAARGARAVVPLEGLNFGQQLAWYARRQHSEMKHAETSRLIASTAQEIGEGT